MAFWNNITKAATQTTSKAVQHAKNLADVAKLNGQIDTEKKSIQTWYLQLGKLYAEVHREDPEHRFSEIVKAITEAEGRIQQMQKQIQTLKGVQCCEKCGAELSKGVAFCSACGAPVPKPEPQPEAQPAVTQKRFCTGCGKELTPEMRFCTGCGTPVAAAAPQTAPAAVEPAPAVVEPVAAEEPATVADPAPVEEAAPVAEESAPDMVEAPAQEREKCSVCGEELIPGMRFCTGCGAPAK